MKLSEFKEQLRTVSQLVFTLPDGTMVPSHFHVTEVGQVTKHFIDCGGTIRNEQVVNFQLFETGNTDHRLAPEKLMKIIGLSEKALQLQDANIEVEYQGETIGKYGLERKGSSFALTRQSTACLARDNCGIPKDKLKVKLTDLQRSGTTCCTPGGGCC